MRRREFLSLIAGAVAWPLVTRAQQPTPRIAWLRSGRPPNSYIEAFLDGLREHGYFDRRNVEIEYWFDESPVQVTELIAKLTAKQITVLMTGTTSTIQLLKKSNFPIPIIMAATSD